MIKQVLVAAALSCFLATSAFASTCPLLVQQINEALAAGPDLSAEQIAEVEALRDQGEAEHKAGDHPTSEASLHQAMQILGLE